MPYDTHCHDIAEWFMIDEPIALHTPANIARIAQRVQDSIEDEIECIDLPPTQPMDKPDTRPQTDLNSMATQVMKIQQFLKRERERVNGNQT